MVAVDIGFSGERVVANGAIDLLDPIHVLLLHPQRLRYRSHEHAGKTICLGFQPPHVLKLSVLVAGLLAEGVRRDQNASSALQCVTEFMGHDDIGGPLVPAYGWKRLR